MRQAMMFSKRGTSSAEVTAAITDAMASLALTVVQTFDPALNVGSNAALSASVGYFARIYVNAPTPINGITFNVGGTAAGTAEVCVGEYDGTTMTILGHSAATTVAGANQKQRLALGSTVTLTPGRRLYLGFVNSAGTTTFLRIQSSTTFAEATNLTERLLAKTAAGNFSSNLTSLSGSQTLVWLAGDLV